MKLEHRLNLSVLPLVVVPLFLLGWIAYDNLYEQSRKASFSSINETLERLSQEIQQEISQAQGSNELLATDLTLVHYALAQSEMERYSIYQRGVLSRFRHYQENHPRYDEVRFILPDGYEETRWAKRGVANATDEEATAWWFPPLQEAGDRPAFFVGHNQDTGANALYVFKPVYLGDVASEGTNPEIRLRGFLGISISLDWLQVKMRWMAQQMQLGVALLSPRGDVLLANRSLSAAQQASIGALFNRENTKSPRHAIEIRTLDGTDYYVGSVGLLGNHTLATAAPAAEIHAAARGLSLKIILITLTAIVATLCVLTLFLRGFVVKPLRELIAASNQIGSGKFATHIEVHGNDEISELASSFNRMAQDLAQSDEKIRFLAHHDSLTNLPNRHMFQLFLEMTIASARRTGTNVALLFLDIDDFKSINDTLGHDTGDKLLQAFAGLISDCLRDTDFLADSGLHSHEDLVARHGGDEFTIILPGIAEPHSAAIVAQRIIDALETEIVLADHELRISTSIGITVFPLDGDSMESLLKAADVAMYHAKEQGRNNYQFYTSELMENIVERVEGEKELRRAIDERQMTLHFQPQIHTATEEIYGFESLVRWQHPERGIIPPLQFIQLAEETGLIVELGAWIMHESCRQAAAWMAQGDSDIRISVNVSSVQFHQQDMAQQITGILAETGLPGHHLTIELTESILIAAGEHTLEQLRLIQNLGVQIALDDFGTGYSSLSYLRTFPVDILKIDRSFIVESEQEADMRVIVAAIVEMAGALSVKVVAEGVEDEAQLKFLESINCDIIQGYYYSKPLPAAEAEHYLQHYQAPVRSADSAA